MNNDKYILEGKNPVPCDDLIKWAKWIEKTPRHVCKDTIKHHKISTVFLGLNHNYSDGPPILFETMIFGEHYDDYQERYATWEEAEKGHQEAIKLVQS